MGEFYKSGKFAIAAPSLHTSSGKCAPERMEKLRQDKKDVEMIWMLRSILVGLNFPPATMEDKMDFVSRRYAIFKELNNDSSQESR